MRILTAQAAGSGNEYAANNEAPRNIVLIVWGTAVTDVDFEVSPDNGATWISLQNITAAGSYILPMAGGTDYLMRGTVTTGTAVNMDFF